MKIFCFGRQSVERYERCCNSGARICFEVHGEFDYRVDAELNREGLPAGRRHVATLIKRMGIEAIYRRPNTSKPAAGHKINPYLLRKLKVESPNQVWVMDITYIPMARGFVYLVALVDWFNPRLSRWASSDCAGSLRATPES